ncbi:unnamed protein product [marine sediment metagenome]|uniref:Uncharacterized protein n=1 Tax=marine sediment metagenome TaxID=412755 RepID=X1GRE6_9ZZZZ
MKEAKKKVYKDEKGNASIEAKAIEAVMRLASAELVKRSERKIMRQTFSAGAFVKPLFLSIGKKKHDLLRKDIVTRGTGDKVTRVPTYRPQFDKWDVKGTIDLIGIEPDFARQALELAGLRFGLYGYRPKFGRFIVKKFLEVKK